MEENWKGLLNGHEYVDLGLSVMWATCNVGADSPEDYGDYYAWGETETKEEYTEKNCETWGKDIGDDIAGTDRDVAHVRWGSPWRMPTKKEFQELIDNCDWEWTTLNRVNGRKMTSKKNGNWIFLPAAGCCLWTPPSGAGRFGHFWSSTHGGGDAWSTCTFDFGCGGYTWNRHVRGFGESVRPVSEFLNGAILIHLTYFVSAI